MLLICSFEIIFIPGQYLPGYYHIVKNGTVFWKDRICQNVIFALVNIKFNEMNKSKSILVMTLILMFAVSCIGNSIAIKRKKQVVLCGRS
jgi:hypothetical protein